MFRHQLGGVGGLESAEMPTARRLSVAGRDADEVLLRRCACKDTEAMEELMRRYQAPLTRYLYRLLSSREDVEETLLDVFVRVWLNAQRFHFHASVSTWLYRIALNRACDLMRARQSRPQTVECNDGVPLTGSLDAEREALQRLLQGERAVKVQRALNRLTVQDRSLLIYYYYEEMDYDEIQQITRMSYTVLKTRMKRARERLRRIVEPV